MYKKQTMKTINLLLLFLLLSLGVVAQSYSPISNEYFVFSSGEKEVFKTSFTKVSAVQVNAAVKEYLKNYKTKIESVKGFDNEYVVNNVVLSDINQNTTNIAIKITELEGNATLYIHYLTDDKIVSKANTPNAFDGYTKFTQAIDDKATFIAYDALIEAQSNVVGDKQKELKGIEMNEEKQHDAIGKSNISIKDSQKAITSLQGSLKNQQSLVAIKTQQVGDKESDIASVNVKTLESNIKDVDKENRDLVKDVEKSRAEIAKINGEIAVAETELETQRKGIAAQKILLGVAADKKAAKEVLSMENEAAKMIGDIEEKKGEIANMNASIVNAQREMNSNKERVGAYQAEIASHSEDALKDQLKILEKDLKDGQSEEKKILKDIEKENDNVTRQEESIRQAEAEIVSIKNAQTAKKEEISTQEEALKSLQATQAKYK